MVLILENVHAPAPLARAPHGLVLVRHACINAEAGSSSTVLSGEGIDFVPSSIGSHDENSGPVVAK